MHQYAEVETAMGKLWVGYSPKGITMISLAKESSAAFEKKYRELYGIQPQKGKLAGRYKKAVVNAASGRSFDPTPVDLSGLTEFQQRVLKELLKVRRGEVRTYSWLARKAGRPLAARAVGNTMARNPVPFLVPCHRVVPSSGGIGNYGLGKARKHELLEREGVRVELL